MQDTSITSELQSSELKGDKAIAKLDDVHQCVEPV